MIKVFWSNSILNIEEDINNFIKNKKIRFIKIQVMEGTSNFYFFAYVINKEKEE